MTKKNAKKTAARARQAKTGQSYQSALRAEGSLTKEEQDNLVAEAIREMGADEFWRRVREARYSNQDKRIHEAFTVLNNGLYHGGVNAPTKDNLMARIQEALKILAGTPFVPRQPLEGFTINKEVGGGFDHEVALASLELPEEVRKRAPLYERFYSNEKGPVEPAKIMEYWKDIPDAKRCTAPARRELGVTDDHPTNPFTTWTPLTRCHETPGFIQWWNTLPEAKVYARFFNGDEPISTADNFRAQYPGEPLPPGMKDPKKPA